jgi:glutamate carboxypeptidase
MNPIAFQNAIATEAGLYLEHLQKIVEMESPSHDPGLLNQVADAIISDWQALGIGCDEIQNEAGAKHLRLKWMPAVVSDQLKPWLVVGHFDTVWPVGTLAKMPFRREGDQVAGPGTYDMKADLVLAWLTARQMLTMGIMPSRPVVFLFSCDEETGSHSSRELIEREARNANAALVLEPPLAGGALKTARKGVGCYRIDITGRSAHAGVEPEKGRSAITELARQILKIQSAAAPELGTTINIGKIAGGTANNVVAEKAWCEIDVRVSSMEEAARIDAFFKNEILPFDQDIRLEVTGGLNRPPMVRSSAAGKLFELCREVAAGFGVSLEEGATGGGSDGNFTAAVGCPTIDGLGLEGAGAHAPHEHINISSLPLRAALLAAILTSEMQLTD